MWSLTGKIQAGEGMRNKIGQEWFAVKFPGQSREIGWVQDIMSNTPPTLSSNSAVKVSLYKVLNHPPVPLELFSGLIRDGTEHFPGGGGGDK